MAMRLRNPLSMLKSVQYALDAGSANTVITDMHGDVLLNEPTVIALDQDTNTVIATGTEAKTYLGKAPERIRVVRPISGGVVVDYDAARELLRLFFSRVHQGQGSRIKICLVAANGITALERRTFEDCCKAAGVSKAFTITAPLAAAIGSGLDIRAPKGRLLIGIGAGLVEVSILSLADIVLSQTAPLGADAFHAAMAHFFASTRQFAIGENMAEQTTLHLASADGTGKERTFTVTGKQSTTGTPVAEEMTGAQTEGALNATLESIVELVRSVLEKAPAELVADIAETGIHLYGGGAALHGLAEYLHKNLGLEARIADKPELASVRGAAAVLRPDLDFKNLMKA